MIQTSTFEKRLFNDHEKVKFTETFTSLQAGKAIISFGVLNSLSPESLLRYEVVYTKKMTRNVEIFASKLTGVQYKYGRRKPLSVLVGEAFELNDFERALLAPFGFMLPESDDNIGHLAEDHLCASVMADDMARDRFKHGIYGVKIGTRSKNGDDDKGIDIWIDSQWGMVPLQIKLSFKNGHKKRHKKKYPNIPLLEYHFSALPWVIIEKLELIARAYKDGRILAL